MKAVRIHELHQRVTEAFFYDLNGSVVAEYEATGGTGYGALKRLNISAGRLLAVDEVQPNGTKVTSYLIADRQGSTRVRMDAAGAVTSRHDYLPFGEELGAGSGALGSPTGMRTSAQGYSAADNVRQRYADTRLDDATGLDHTRWRKLETRSGRWTTPDPYGNSLRVANPQSFNRYAYVHNDPVNFVDPSGLDPDDPIDIGNAGNVDIPIKFDDPISGIGGWLGGDTGMVLEAPAPPPDQPTGGGGAEIDPEKEALCKRLMKFQVVMSEVFEEYMNAKEENENLPWWRDSNPTEDDWGKAFVGAVIGAIFFRNPGGAVIGIGISLAGNTLYIEGQNLIDPRLSGDLQGFQKAFKAFNDRAQAVYKEMEVSTEEHASWREFRKSGGNCGGAGGSW